MSFETVTWTATLYSAMVWLWLGWLAMGTPIGLLLLAWGLYGRRGPTGVPTCPQCGQDMRAQHQLKCPTCQYQPDTESEWFRPRRRRKALYLAMLLLLPWAYPLFAILMQGWDHAIYRFRVEWPMEAVAHQPVALPLVLERVPAWAHPIWNRITVVHLIGRIPDDEDFAHLAYLTALRVLRIDMGQRLTDDALEAFENKSSLTDVELHSTGITDRGLKFLESSPRLQHLSLPGAKLNGSALQYLYAAPLRQLNLAHTELSSGALRHIGSHTTLTHLNLAATRIPDNALPALRSLPNLQVLVLDGCPITNDALGELARHKQLHTLSLKGTQITPDAATPLFDHIPTLQQIQFQGNTLNRPAAASQPPAEGN